MKSVVKLIVTVVVLGIVMGSYLIANRDEATEVVVHRVSLRGASRLYGSRNVLQPVRPRFTNRRATHVRQTDPVARFFAYPDYGPTLKAGDYVTALRTAETYDALNTIVAYVGAVEAQRLADEAAAHIAAYARSIPPPHPAPNETRASGSQSAGLGSGGGFPSLDWIVRLGRCEQPGDGPYGIAITNRVGGYPGGFGFLPGAWSNVRDASWPASMADASFDQQVEAVRRLGARVGFTPNVWGCINTIGGPY